MDTHRATASLPWIDGPAVRAALSPRAAVDPEHPRRILANFRTLFG